MPISLLENSSMRYLGGAVGFLLIVHMTTKQNKILVLSQSLLSWIWLLFKILHKEGEKNR